MKKILISCCIIMVILLSGCRMRQGGTPEPGPVTTASGSTTENFDAKTILEKHEKGLIDDETFLETFGKVNIFYSTPFGDHKDGGSRLFVLPDGEKTAFLPVFISIERITEFYNKVGRRGFMIIEGSFLSFLETTRSINKGGAPVKLGAVIEPGYYDVTVDADMLDAAISMMA